MICVNCHNQTSQLSAVIRGKYYDRLCRECKASLQANDVSSGHARWERSIDTEDHELDIQQPWNADGTPNLRFIRAYPKQAASVFTEKQMRDASK